jgi:hypothetical protein
MIVAAKIEGEFSTLEVYLYEESKCTIKYYFKAICLCIMKFNYQHSLYHWNGLK